MLSLGDHLVDHAVIAVAHSRHRHTMLVGERSQLGQARRVHRLVVQRGHDMFADHRAQTLERLW